VLFLIALSNLYSFSFHLKLLSCIYVSVSQAGRKVTVSRSLAFSDLTRSFAFVFIVLDPSVKLTMGRFLESLSKSLIAICPKN